MLSNLNDILSRPLPQYRDCVFRKMFERPTVLSATADGRVDDIVRNVRELCHLDPA